jgi:dTDP-glucose pyrophosphorylase
MVLGDNIFYGSVFVMMLGEAARTRKGTATFSVYHVENPVQFGVVEFD